ncbi:hypothetical protein Pmani_034916 [Petrolisthes manimaculis]|uniref:C-type lectin domain-containing protein n=1 Tax=Petrolisthes manimaculis TaxID=1843537 RepID=A0AAE1NNF3_9EUCA|nr:hypothetical protein Pmani_034916 [Petrolisthes manimaculis]
MLIHAHTVSLVLLLLIHLPIPPATAEPREPRATAAIVAPVVPECPNDWLHDDSGLCVWVSTEKAVWWRAANTCQTLNSRLTYIESEREGFIITGILIAKGINATWIGLNDLDVESSFNWVGSEPITYSNFAIGQPSGRGVHADEDCVAISSDLGYMWDDLYCFLELRFVCRKDMIN